MGTLVRVARVARVAQVAQVAQVDTADLHHESLSSNVDQEAPKVEAGMVAPKDSVAQKSVVVPVVRVVPKDQEGLVASVVRRHDRVWCYLILLSSRWGYPTSKKTSWPRCKKKSTGNSLRSSPTSRSRKWKTISHLHMDLAMEKAAARVETRIVHSVLSDHSSSPETSNGKLLASAFLNRWCQRLA